MPSPHADRNGTRENSRLLFMPSCVHRPSGGRSGEVKTVGLSSLNPPEVSVVLVCREDENCGPEALRRTLTAELQARGIRVVSPSKTSRTVSLQCCDLPDPQRNKLPVAPGSRLWYQSRVFSPKTRRSASARPAGAPLRLEATLAASQPAQAVMREKPLRAGVMVVDRSEPGLKSAVGAVLDALQ